MKCSRETLQNLLYFMYKKTHVVFFVFHFMQLYIFTLVYVDIDFDIEVFHWNISLSANFLFQKSDLEEYVILSLSIYRP